MKLFIPHIILFLLCVVSRLLSGINYIEGPESLIVAEDTLNFIRSSDEDKSIYPLFTFISWALFQIFKSLPTTFALVGGISVYLIILFTTKIIRVPVFSLEGIIVAILIFFNPFIWILSTSFLPQILGLVLALGSFNYLLIQNYRKQNLICGWIILGVLIGTYSPFLLFLIIPALLCIHKRPGYWYYLLYTLIGISLWALPLILFTDQFDITSLFSFQYIYVPEKAESVWTKIINIFSFLWADSFGGYMSDRSLWLLPLSLGTTIFFAFGLMIIIDFDYPKDVLLGSLVAIVFFTVFTVLFQNIKYYPDNLLILIPFFSISLAYGIIYFLVNFNNLYVKTLIGIYIVFLVSIGIFAAKEHRNRSTISQVKQFLKQAELPESVTIISNSPINTFLKKQKIQARYADLTGPELLLQKNDSIIVINETRLPKFHYHQKFTHNKYINRYLPVLYLQSNFTITSK